jgi:hypothetical protein
MRPKLSEKDYKQIEDNLKNTDEAFTLLELIEAEFRSDPLSVQCFDLRVVERVKACVAARKRFEKDGPFFAR